jgi:transcriptional regulator with XRE-family HTH domain
VVPTKANALGEFLRARREQLRPEDVGLAAGARRRVAGLRREELAMLAGISSDYYLRLEQGRDTNPSAQVVDALARALQLDVKATEYLHQLANPSVSGRGAAATDATDGLAELIDQFPMPAIVANRCLDVLTANPVARALSPGLRARGEFPALAASGSRRSRALRGLGCGNRCCGEWVARSGRKRCR